MFNFLYNNSKTENDIMFDGIKELINYGNKTREIYITHKIYMTQQELDLWLDHSKQMVMIITRNRPAIYANYLAFVTEINSRNIEPYSKYQASLDYLIEILKLLSKS